MLPFGPFETFSIYAVLVCGVIGLIYALYLRKQTIAMDQGTEKMQQIAAQIQEGAYAYLNRQFKTIAVVIVILFFALLLSAWGNWSIAFGRAIAFVLGCFASGFTGYMGMTLAVQGNVRCAAAARTSLADSMRIAFRSGAVAGMFTVTMGLVGAVLIFWYYKEMATEVLLGFGFGGSLLALFMRVGGGIYTKAADVGADLVGKVEAGIPEDDPRNAAVIADQVGDNVGDCAGMAADIFESYEVTLVASMILALAHGDPKVALVWIMFPLLIRGVGVITSMIGISMVKSRTDDEHPMKPITRGFIWSAILSAVGFFIIAKFYVGANDPQNWLKLFLATISGLVLAVAMYKLTEYFTSTQFGPVKSVARSAQTGSATTILTGFAEGLESSVYAVLVICGSVFFSILVFGREASAIEILYGVSLCGLGMLTTTGVIISMDTYGPVADNAQGITEMSGAEGGPNVEILDAVGNTTKAATKGIAIASAVIAAISLYGSYLSKVASGIAGGHAGEAISESALREFWIQVDKPAVFIGLLIGGSMPFLFSAMTIRAVSRAAFYIINEVRRQFREIPGLREGKEGVLPESGKVVDICTGSAIRELVGPGILSVLSPVIVGCWLGWEGLGGFLAGIIVCGQLMAVFMCNAGGAWYNAKKLIEDGLYGGKGSEAHKAAVVGDTVGDPFKDTAGPALNPLIKVMNLVGLLVAPVIVKYSFGIKNVNPSPGLAIVGVVLAVIVAIALMMSKRESAESLAVQKRLEDTEGKSDVA
ncbi:MAG: sodium-translocating pyrophosphatase [Armatimonadetes bacterium]|nr:sodium-translocating pyrophosphatase [Armatimonadota bacterium]